MTIQTYDFTTPGDYTVGSGAVVAAGVAQLSVTNPATNYTRAFDNATGLTVDLAIEIVGPVMQLELQNVPGQSFNEDFIDDTGFTYNATNTEFTGGLVRQIQKTYKSTYYLGTFFANYDSNLDGNYGNGVLTGTPTGGAAVSGGKLDLRGGTTKYVSYVATGNADSLQVGCIRFKYTPNYSGTPAADQNMFCLSQGLVNDNNSLVIRHNSVTGNIFLRTCNNVGSYINADVQVGAWSPVSGTEYEIEFNWDYTVGAARIFINGIQIGATETTTGTRSGAVASLRIGNFNTSDFTSDFEINDFMVFAYPQHTANYTPSAYGLADPKQPTLFASFDVNDDSAWANGSTNNSLSGGAIWSNGRIDLTGNSGRTLNMPGLTNFSLAGSSGCIRFIYRPNYTGFPAVNSLILEYDAATGSNNAIFITHNTNNTFTIDLRDSTGTTHPFTTSAQSLVSGVDYELELSFNCYNGGVSTFFINGNSIGTLSTATWTRVPEDGTFYWGGSGNFWIDNIVLFNHSQHTANYTPNWTNILPYEYYSDVVTLPEMHYTNPGTLISFDNLATTETNGPRYTLQIGQSGDYLWWSGSGWTISDNTYAQANPLATFVANEGTLPVLGEVYGQFRIYTQNSIGVQQSVADLTATLTTQIYPTTNPTIDIDAALRATITTNIIDDWNSFSQTASIAGSDAIRYTLSDDNGVTYLYWDGGAWSVSSGYAQSNTAAEVNTNIGTFPLTLSGMKIRLYLHSNNGTTTPSITSLTVGYDDSIYPITNPTVRPTTSLNVEEVTGVTSTEVIVGSDQVRHVCNIGGTGYWWDGLAWATSSGYAQSNTIVEINTNIGTFTFTGVTTFYLLSYIHSATGATSPTLDNVAITYNIHGGVAADPVECLVYSYIYDANGRPIPNVIVRIELTEDAAYQNLIITKKLVEVITGADGYWEALLVENISMLPTIGYEFKIKGSGIHATYRKRVPNQASQDLNNCVDLP